MNRNTLIIGGAIVLVVLGLGALFMRQSSPSDDSLRVSATIFPLYDIVREVAGDDVGVDLILPPGASPHTFDPSPSAVREASDSAIIFAIGHTLDDWALDLRDQAGDGEVVIVDNGIQLKPFSVFEIDEHADEHEDHDHDEHDDHYDHDEHDEDEHHEEHEGHSHGAIDPHYWLSPTNAAIIANTVAMELAELDPTNKDDYMARASDFEAKVFAERDAWQERLANEVRPVVTLHDAFAYYAEDMGFNIVASIEPFPGKEPTPRYLQELSEIIRRENVATIYLEPQLGTDSIVSLSRDLGVGLGQLDPLGGVDGRESYIDLLDFNGQQILNPEI